MDIQKPYLETFSTDELMRFIDHYTETGEILHVPGHPWGPCDQLARFLGFGYDRTWAQQESDILAARYPELGADKTAALLPLRSPLDCAQRAHMMGLKTDVRGPKTRKGCAPWVLWELDILTKYYPVIGSKTAILLEGRSEFACSKKATAAGLTVITPVPWTDEEIESLKKFYPLIGADLEDLLPGKSRGNIQARARMEGLSAPSQKWTPAEDELIKLHYPQMGMDVSRFFGGRRSRWSCYARAASLGVACVMQRIRWSEDELAVLDANYPLLGSKVCELLPGRSGNSCSKMAVKRHLSYRPCDGDRPGSAQEHPSTSTQAQPRAHGWDKDEDELLKRHYASMGMETASLLPGRSKSACQNRARSLGLHKARNVWTDEEDAVLKEFYPREGAAAFQRLANRTESACRTRLSTLGLTMRKAADSSNSGETESMA